MEKAWLLNQPESEKVSWGRETSHGGMSEKGNKAEFSRREVSIQFSSAVQSCLALCNPMDCSTPGLQNARPLCPSPTPGTCSNSCPLSWWCHPTVSSSVILFSSHLQSFPASGSFLVSQFFTSGGQSIGVCASASVLPMTCPKVRQLFHLVSQYNGSHFTVVWPIYVRTEAWSLVYVLWPCHSAYEFLVPNPCPLH